jgi:CRISPR-associated exonuclease Cas4
VTDGTKHLQCTEDIFTSLDDKKKFNMTYWINPDRGEFFFAKKVVLVEGQTDKSVLSYLSKQLGCFRYDYTLIDCGSKDNIPLYMHLLNSFKLPYVAVYDKDHQTGKHTDAIASADASTGRITAKLDATYGYLVELENDIEEEIGITDVGNKNKPHVAMEHISQDTFTITPTLSAKITTIFS